MKLFFGCWSPSEAVFWQSWISAGICTAPNEFASRYAGQVEVSTSWSGIVAKADGTTVPGWHCNVRIEDALAEEFAYGLNQIDAEGVMLPLFDRTWAAEVFGLTYQPADPVTGFPAGMRDNTGVTYADPAAFRSPSLVWA